MFTGGEVIFGCIDEGNSEVEQEIDDQRTGVFCQENLKNNNTLEDLH